MCNNHITVDTRLTRNFWRSLLSAKVDWAGLTPPRIVSLGEEERTRVIVVCEKATVRD